MKLIVCPLDEVRRQVAWARPAGVVSLLAPDQPSPRLPGAGTRLVLRFHDIVEPRPGFTQARADDLGRLLAFTQAFPPQATLLIHCWMGISRSPAAAFILACARNPERPETEIAVALRKAAPSATPNAHLIALADERLARRGRMTAAISAIGRGCEASLGSPFELDA
jgi:predicted protein tyrosine phosphatase